MSIFKLSHFPLGTKKSDIQFLFEMAKHSDYVNSNPDYKKKTNNTKIDYLDNTEVNAYAQSLSEHSHKITILSGICNTAKLTAIALAHFKLDDDIEKLKELCNWIGNSVITSGGKFKISDITDGIEKFNYELDGIIPIEAKSYAAGSILAVIAHELGHICLSHTVREEESHEISRNDERQADLFGCSVTLTTPFSSHIILAGLFVEIIFTWMSKTKVVSTHPHSRERVYNTVNAHDNVLNALGISLDNIDDFLPER